MVSSCIMPGMVDDRWHDIAYLLNRLIHSPRSLEQLSMACTSRLVDLCDISDLTCEVAAVLRGASPSSLRQGNIE